MRVLVVEDEALVALTIEDTLTEAGYDVVGIADRPEEALELAGQHKPGLAVVDVRLASGGDGIALAELLLAAGPMRILFATANCGEVRRRARHGHGCLSKPFEAGSLVRALRAVISGQPADIPGYFSLPFDSET
ncbi:MAG: response regulator [Acetobacteraceae bacterium]|nr:response regulator [Acetobacteraceae bacterium]